MRGKQPGSLPQCDRQEERGRRRRGRKERVQKVEEERRTEVTELLFSKCSRSIYMDQPLLRGGETERQTDRHREREREGGEGRE